MEIEAISNVVGIAGVSLVLLMYILLQIGRVRPSDIIYSICNFLGATFILFSLYFHWNLSSVIIEFVWMATSIFGILKAVKKKNVTEQ